MKEFIERAQHCLLDSTLIRFLIFLAECHPVHNDNPLTQHDGLHVLDDDLPGHGGGAVQHDVLPALPVLGLELPDEVQSVLGCLYLSRSLNRERW